MFDPASCTTYTCVLHRCMLPLPCAFVSIYAVHGGQLSVAYNVAPQTCFASSFIGCTCVNPARVHHQTATNATVCLLPPAAGAIIAVSPLASAVTANGFTCKFTKAHTAYKPAQITNLLKYAYSPSKTLDDVGAVYRLPANLASIKDKVRCTYMLYGKTGFNYTYGQTCVPTGDPSSPQNCTAAPPFDVPSIQWQFDRDNKPAASNYSGTPVTITCAVNKALLNRKDTAFQILPNDGTCFPAVARYNACGTQAYCAAGGW